MKKLLLLSFLVSSMSLLAQVGINTTTPAAQLDIKSSNQATPANTDGLLIPKIDTFPATNPTAAQQGMLAYLTTASGINQPGFYYWDNSTTSWISVSGKPGWSLTGNTGTIAGTNYIGTKDANDLVFDTNEQERMRIKQTSGNIGIGNAFPSESFQVENNIKIGDAFWSTTANNRFLKFGDGNYVTIGEEFADDYLSFKAKNFLFSPSGFNSGFVGIGTMAPTQKLDVQNGNARINNLIVGEIGFGTNWAGLGHQSTANTTGYGFLQLNDGSFTLINKQNTGSGYIGFRVGNNDKMVVLNNGNVGIGLTDPTNNLHVFNPSTDNTDTNVFSARNNSLRGSTWTMGSIEYYTEGQANIGFSSRVSPLIGDGTIHLGGLFNDKYNGFRWGTLYCTTNPDVSSDFSLKKEIKSLTYGLSHIRKINPISYIFKSEKLPNGVELDDSDKTIMLGFSAQELQEVLPEVVSSWGWISDDEKNYYKKNSKTLGVRYGDIIPVAINAIKELDKIVQERTLLLQEKIKSLEEINSAILKRLEKLENK
jgi:Chaperone of endosialidase